MVLDFNLPEPQRAKYDLIYRLTDSGLRLECGAEKLGNLSGPVGDLLNRIVDKYKNPREVRIQIDVR